MFLKRIKVKKRKMVFFAIMLVAFAIQSMASETKSIRVMKLPKKQCHNLICLFDPDRYEGIWAYKNAIGNDFVDALNEKIAPIIATTNFIYNFCYWKKHESRIKQKLQTIQNNLIGRFDQRLDFLQKVMNTDLVGWECFFHKRAGLVLLIPQQYSKAERGFDLNSLDKMSGELYSAILQYVENHESAHDKIIEDFKSMFIKKDLLSVWNIYISGHGGPTKEIKGKKINEQKIAQLIKKIQARIQVIKEEGFNEEELNKQEKKIEKLLDQLKQPRLQGLSWQKEFLGNIAGLKNQDFMQLMGFFEHGIKASFVHYETCFAGGFNQIILNQQLANLDVSFIVSTHGINESSTTYVEKKMKFTAFFKKLEALMCDASDIIGNQEAINELIKDSIAEIVESLINKASLDYNQPFVRIPSVGVFKASDIAQEVQLLTHSLARAHEAEGSPIDYTDSSIKTIFIYPSYIKVPIKIKEHVAIVSPAPQSVEDIDKPTIHVLENVSYQDTLSSIIPNFASFNTRYQRIIFVIKELYCLDGQYLKLDDGKNSPILLKNVIIKIAPADSLQGQYGGYMDASIDVAFTYNNRDYAISKRVNAIQDNMKGLFDAFEEEKIEPVAAKDMQSVAEKLIGKVGIAKLARENKAITLPSMVGYFEQLMNRFSQNKKTVSNVKNAVLLKKIKKLERLTSDAALKMQKAFITKTESMPGLMWMKRIERLQKNAQILLDQTNKVVISDAQNAALLSTKAKVEKIFQMLEKEHALATKQLSVQEQDVLASEKSPGVLQRAAGALQKAGEAIDKAGDAVVRQARKAYSYVTGKKEEKEYRYGYGKPR
jgi:hypothetical protein